MATVTNDQYMSHQQTTYTASQRMAAVELLTESEWRFKTIGFSGDGSPLGYWDNETISDMWPKSQEFYSGALAAIAVYTSITPADILDRARANYYQR